jgi:hypothetical protein
MTSTIGIPIKLLNEAQGHIVTLEITSGQTYRGKLIEGMLAFHPWIRSEQLLTFCVCVQQRKTT